MPELSTAQREYLDKVGHFEITTYHHDGSNIIIEKIKAVDNDGNYMKFVKLDKVLPFLSLKPIRFKSKLEENPLVRELMDRFDAKPIIKT